jgi:hypothetical protein
LAEADGNRTRQRQSLPFNGFEDRAGHQTGYASLTSPAILANICRVCDRWGGGGNMGAWDID